MRKVPANCSRYFEKKQDAENQPTAVINLDLDASEMFVINTMFDENLIIQDLQYCTTNRFQLMNSVKNFEKVGLYLHALALSWVSRSRCMWGVHSL